MRRLVLLAALLAAGCGGGETYDGGRDSLPGPVPKDASYAPADTTAVAPPFALKLLDGSSLDAGTLWRDRPAVVFFFASWCSRCATQQTSLAKLSERYGDKLAFIGVAGKDTNEKLRPWLSEHKVSYPVAIDPDLATWRRYAVRTPPAVILVAPGGKLFRGWPGGVDAETLEAAVDELVD